MGKEENLKRIIDCGITAIVRFERSEQLVQVAHAIKAGGIDVIEFTMTTPNALAIIEETAREFGDEVLLGAGTVLDAETARAAILAGAEFIVSPTLSRATIEMCRRYSKIVIPGTMTPTEILTAWEWGADLVKVFPVERLGGPRYIRDVLAPLPQVRLVPTGGVDLSNVADFIRAGAVAVAAGTSLVSKKAVAEGDFESLTDTARKFVAAVREARGK
ncbi:MAG: bifunctional 4-hydroxy-2-oxoglutarate aldolase/2-dehydro-3-deoxy-phosphogluconate aldolase [Anaerolineae bacterium]